MSNLIKLDGELTVTKALAKEIIIVKTRLEQLKETDKKIKAALLEEMILNDIVKVDTPDIALTRKDGYDVEHFDKQAFKEDFPDLYDQYVSIRHVDPSVLIKVKEQWKHGQ